MLFSAVLALRSMQRWMKSGHFLLVLGWSVESQFTHLTSFSDGQLGVLWLPAHVPQVSLFALQEHAICPHFWHLRHCIGSFLSLRARRQVLLMYMPSFRSLFAAVGEVSVNIACAKLWKGLPLAIGLIHLADVIVPTGILLSSSVKRRVSLSSNAVHTGTNGTTRLYILSLIVSAPPVASANFCQCSCCLVQSTASLLGSSSSMPPFLRMNNDLIFKSGPLSLISSSTDWKRVTISSCKHNCFLIGWSPARSMRSCLSLVAAFALACVEDAKYVDRQLCQ